MRLEIGFDRDHFESIVGDFWFAWATIALAAFVLGNVKSWALFALALLAFCAIYASVREVNR